MRSRIMHFSRCLCSVATASLVLFSFQRDADAQGKSKSGVALQYTVSTLGILNNPGASTVVRRVNALGEVVGGFKDKSDGASAAFLLTSTGFASIANQQVSDFSASYGINDTGEIAGIVNGPLAVLPFRAVRQTGFQLLPLLNGDTSGGAFGINSAGEAVGYSSGPSGVRALWWTRKGVPTVLPSLNGASTTKAIDINTKGDVVGFAGEGMTTAVLWPNKGGIFPLGTLSGYTSALADSISDKGDVAGSATAYDSTEVRMHAVLWSAGSLTPMDLGTLPGGVTSRARDVDANSVVVGTSSSTSGNHAFIWSSSGGMQDLNSLSADTTIVLIDALSISSKGVILALGVSKSDFPPGDPQDAEEHELPRHIVLLTPSK